ncbi:unnamed protein product [Ceratitis capitata]|uniref:(Mediterranean fruit fly) hypothetical protein n=1 Tax=Ceratitis capitata TaxID=7213 RepID=A0A811UH90_CERCA|nr:unnamed protein product [Ceratitis capitata]
MYDAAFALSAIVKRTGGQSTATIEAANVGNKAGDSCAKADFAIDCSINVPLLTTITRQATKIIRGMIPLLLQQNKSHAAASLSNEELETEANQNVF